jgi:hypothetical protein
MINDLLVGMGSPMDYPFCFNSLESKFWNRVPGSYVLTAILILLEVSNEGQNQGIFRLCFIDDHQWLHQQAGPYSGG